MVAVTQGRQLGEGGESAQQPRRWTLNVLEKDHGCSYCGVPGGVSSKVEASIWPSSEEKKTVDPNWCGRWWFGAGVEMCDFLFLRRTKETGWKEKKGLKLSNIKVLSTKEFSGVIRETHNKNPPLEYNGWWRGKQSRTHCYTLVSHTEFLPLTKNVYWIPAGIWAEDSCVAKEYLYIWDNWKQTRKAR